MSEEVQSYHMGGMVCCLTKEFEMIHQLNWDKPLISPQDASSTLIGQLSHREMAMALFVDLAVANNGWCGATLRVLEKRLADKHGKEARFIRKSVQNLIRQGRVEIIRIPRFRIWRFQLFSRKFAQPTTVFLERLYIRKLKLSR